MKRSHLKALKAAHKPTRSRLMHQMNTQISIFVAQKFAWRNFLYQQLL